MSKLTAYTGLDFYESYILPTNNSSKNPLWKTLWSFQKKRITGEKSLEDRVHMAYYCGGAHAVFAVLTAFAAPDVVMDPRMIIIQLLGNIYPIFLQVKIRNRIHRILKNKKRAKPTQEERLEELLEADIRLLESKVRT